MHVVRHSIRPFGAPSSCEAVKDNAVARITSTPKRQTDGGTGLDVPSYKKTQSISGAGYAADSERQVKKTGREKVTVKIGYVKTAGS